MIRLLLAEDEAMVRGALAALLELEDDLTVVEQVARGGDVVAAAERSDPDVVLLDIELPGVDGLTVAERLRSRMPDVLVIMVTTFDRPGYLQRALDAGARGFLVKDDPADELASAIRRVVAGERVIDHDLAVAAMSAGPNPLTSRERDVLAAAEDGATVADIADDLALSEGTVRNYLSSAIQKTGGRNRIEAARTAQEQGWL